MCVCVNKTQHHYEMLQMINITTFIPSSPFSSSPDSAFYPLIALPQSSPDLLLPPFVCKGGGGRGPRGQADWRNGAPGHPRVGAGVWGSGDPGKPLEREAGPGRPPPTRPQRPQAVRHRGPPALPAGLALRELRSGQERVLFLWFFPRN